MHPEAPSPTTGLTVVSVFHEPELLMQRIQARSLDVYLTGPAPTAVLLVDNTRRGLSRSDRSRLLADHGRLADVVRILRPGDIAAIPRATGWRTQQVLKLAVAQHVTTSHYVVLDAKNHLVAPAGVEVFVSAEGRALVPMHGYRSHPLGPSLQRVLSYCGLDPENHLDRFTGTITPFVIDTSAARAVVLGVAQRAGRPFAVEFVQESLTEFFLYSAWSLAHGHTWEDLLHRADPVGVTVWPKAGHTAGVAAALEESAASGWPFFAVHRRAVLSMDSAALHLLADFWVDRGLLPPGEGRQLVAAMGRQIAAHHRRARLLELPAKGTAAARKLRRRVRDHRS